MTRDCGQHRDDQRLRTQYRRLPETADTPGRPRRWIE
ncbi:unnamed protein product, partial [Staurois parvus]